VRRESTPELPAWVAVKSRGQEGASIDPYRTPQSVKTRGFLGRLAGQFRPYDSGTRVLLGGAAGLLAIICADTLVGLGHANFLRSLYDATRTTATISAPALSDQPWLLLWATAAALFVMCFTAMFAAGIVNYLLSGRHAAIFGRRVAPRFGHVIVVGMGQVGLRLAQELRALGVAVIGIEQNTNARSLPIARSSGIPVLIGDGASKAALAAAGAHRAIALVAAGSEERDNIAVAVAALAANPQLRVVLRSGSDDAIEETRSLFRIGAVVDVNGLTASFVAASLDDKSPFAIIPTPDGDMAIDQSGAATEFWPPHPLRCSCP
ncbi:MAG: NAD-binding protein, partial [Chthoniobacterales bacterium]